MPEPPDPSLKAPVEAIIADQYFQYLVRQSAEAMVEHHLRILVRWATAPALVIGAVLVYLGLDIRGSYQTAQEQFKKIGDLAARAEGIQKGLAAVEGQAREQLTTLHSKSTEAITNVRETAKAAESSNLALLNTSMNAANMMHSALQRSLGDVDSKLREVDGKLVEVASTSGTYSKKLKDVEELQKQAEAASRELAKKYSGIQSQLTDVNDRAVQFDRSVKGIESRLSLEKQLAVASTWTVITMRARSTEIVTLADPFNENSAYQFTFSTFAGIQPPVRLKVDVSKNGRPAASQELQLSGTKNAGPASKTAHRITGVPFEVMADFIYHTKWAPDFVAIRLQAIAPTESASN